MEQSRTHQKKKKLSTPLSNKAVTLLVMAVGVMLVCCFAFELNRKKEHIISDVKSSEYATLLRRAKELTNKYQELTDAPPLSSRLPMPHVLANEKENIVNHISSKLQSFGNQLNVASKDLVVGMAQDTDAKNFVVFCRSLRSVSQADATIFVNTPIPERHQVIAKDNRITLVGFDIATITPKFMRDYHPSTLRWALFHRYFQEQRMGDQYRRIWMIDVRDSFFQSDPFAFMPLPQSQDKSASYFHVFTGVESFPIKECGWNSGWIKDCFGSAVLGNIGSRGIICSGVSAGSASAAVEYVRMMNDIVTGQHSDSSSSGTYRALANNFPQCERNGVDQGAHNVLVHTGALNHLQVRKWGQTDGPVSNMQSRLAKLTCREDSDKQQSSCTVQNRVGDTVAVVHQYDRYPELQRYLFQKYVDWVKTGDLQAEWNFEPACRNSYSYKADTDLFKGVCDMPHKGGITSASVCCALCDAKRDQGCQGFTFFAGTCYLKSCGRGGSGSSRGMSISGAVSGYLTS